MAGEDAKATIGGDATPLQKVFADVQAAAKKTGQTIGLELGTRRQAGEEMRMQRGLDMFLRSLSGATDPITAVTGAVEGLGRAFRVVGPLMIATAIGGFLYEQFTKATEASDKLITSLRKSTEVNVATSSVAELKRQVESFDKIEEQYNDRGLLEKIIFGASGGDSLHQAALDLNELRKATIQLDEAAKNAALSEAKLLEASSNPADQKRGADLRQQLAAQDDQRDAQDRLDLAKKQETKHQQELDAATKELEMRRAGVRRASRHFNAEAQVEAEIEQRRTLAAKALEKDKQIVADNEKALANYRGAARLEANKANSANIVIDSKEVGRIQAETQALAFEDELAKTVTPGKKAALLRGQLDADKAKARLLVGPGLEVQHAQALNKIKQDQLKLDQLLTEQANKQWALAQQQVDLVFEKADAQKDVARAQVDAMGFHGEVSSLRRLGFAGGIGSNKNQQQLKTLEESKKHLQKIEQEITKLAGDSAREGA